MLAEAEREDLIAEAAFLSGLAEALLSLMTSIETVVAFTTPVVSSTRVSPAQAIEMLAISSS